MDGSDHLQKNVPTTGGLKLKRLDLDQVRHIDDLLASIGDYGEVHLIVQHGELRYINRVESYKAWRNGESSRK